MTNTQSPAPGVAASETAAKLIYETWLELDGYKPWQDGGNSTKQDDARRIAAQVHAALQASAAAVEQDVIAWEVTYAAAGDDLSTSKIVTKYPAFPDDYEKIRPLKYADTAPPLPAQVQAAEVDALPCPNCDGTGSITVSSDNGPDAYDVEIDCPHCGGKQTLADAYQGVRTLLEAEQEAHRNTRVIIWGRYGKDQIGALQHRIANIIEHVKPEHINWVRERLTELGQTATDYLAAPYPSPAPQAVGAVLTDVANERARQDEKWGGAAHDDEHDAPVFCQLIEDYAGWARAMAGMNSPDKARRRLVQVAALAVAACESIDRAAIREEHYAAIEAGRAGS